MIKYEEEDIIFDLTFSLALEIVNYCGILEEKGGFIMSKKLLKTSTLIRANIRDAQNADRKADFIHKLIVAAKNADETEYWLIRCKESQNYPTPDKLLSRIGEITKVLSKIISSFKQRDTELKSLQILKSLN